MSDRSRSPLPRVRDGRRTSPRRTQERVRRRETGPQLGGAAAGAAGAADRRADPGGLPADPAVPVEVRDAGRLPDTLYLANVALAALTTALILLPVSVHRRLFRLHLKATLVSSADRIAKVALAGVGLLSVGTSSLVFDVTAGRAAGCGAGAVLLAVLLSCWSMSRAGCAGRPKRRAEVTKAAGVSRQHTAADHAEMGKDHGLLLANIGLFLVFFGGMILSGASRLQRGPAGPRRTGGRRAGVPGHRRVPRGDL